MTLIGRDRRIAGFFPTPRGVLLACFLLLVASEPLTAPDTFAHDTVAQGASDPAIACSAVIDLDIEAHRAAIRAELTVPATVDTLYLNGGFAVTSLTFPAGGVAGLPAPPAAAFTILDVDETREADGAPDRILDLTSLRTTNEPLQLVVEYDGTFLQSTDDVVFSRENVGGEIEMTIGEEGVYLSSGAAWLPTSDEALATYTITVNSPAGWEPVTQGRRIARESSDTGLHTVWQTAFPSDGINLIVNRYIVAEQPVGAAGQVTAYTFLLEDDQRLRDLYLERTGAYVDMYEAMIGPYPYSKFATVENWFPTGYGMPSYTLLGGVVLRLPFIPYTSFGHEICHNWWGNSVFVNLDEGNWCEGLTSYCADYHYKQLESDDAAREYRRNLLKDYAAYVKDPVNDFPLAEFLSRHSGATRAVGYGKSMMVFHMIDRHIGRDSFLAGLRSVYADFRFRRAAWSDFLRAFAAAAEAAVGDDDGGTGKSLDVKRWREQWLERAGAPVLTLTEVKKSGDRVRFELRQGETPAYELQIPVSIETAAGVVERTVTLDKPADTFEIAATAARSLAIDPDYHLFRRLDPVEIEPTISQVLAEESPLFIVPGSDPQEAAAAETFARTFAETDVPTIFTGGEYPTDLARGTMPSNVVFNPPGEMLKEYAPSELTVAGNNVYIDGKRYNLKGFDLVFAATNPHDETTTDLVIVCGSPQRLPSLARRVGHYGKYSWLLMPTGQGRTLRGNWAPASSPLEVDLRK